MARREKPNTRMRKAVDSQNAQEFAWGLLEMSRLELKELGDFKTLSSTDIKNILQALITKEKGEDSTSSDAVITDIREYLKK